MPRPLATNTGKRTNRDIRNTCWLKRECEAMEVSMEDTYLSDLHKSSEESAVEDAHTTCEVARK